MKKVLYILGELDDRDADWLAASGTQRRVAAGEVLIQEGQEVDAVFFVTRGTFRVSTGSPPEVVATVGVGEVLGEISFVDRLPPTATVTAVEDARVLAISRTALHRKIQEDPAFAARFYKAVAVFMAERLRRVMHGPSHPDAFADELDLDALDSVSRAGSRFERILSKLQQG